MRTCARCGATSPPRGFIQSYCQPCNVQRVADWRERNRWRNRAVRIRTEDELRMALKDPYPFYAEARR